MTYSQSEFDIRCEWGEHGVASLAPESDVVVLVDVLSFSTCVDIATARGATIFPYRWKDASAADYAASIGAVAADARRGGSGFSLSPRSLLDIAPGTRLVLPSPNGSTLTLGTGDALALAGCLRNATAVAAAAEAHGRRIAVIPAGERWRTDGSLRPAFEDWIGAGAIIDALPGRRSPEAAAAASAFRAAGSLIVEMVRSCGSGKELLENGFDEDVALASALNVSTCVPIYRDGGYVSAGAEGRVER